MANQCRLGLLLIIMSAFSSATFAQEHRCPHFSGAAKKRVEQRARWLVSESLQKQVAQESSAFGSLIAFEQCHVLMTRLLSEDFSLLEGPFFFNDGVSLTSLVGRYHGTWLMAVAPTDPAGKMPAANLLELTEHTWTLLYRDESAQTRVIATGKY